MTVHTPTPDRTVALGDLADMDAVAEIIGVASRHVVSALIARRDDFPSPAVRAGTIRLWVRSDVETWERTYREGQRRDYRSRR